MSLDNVAWLDPSMMYEFEVPHDLAGLVIGREGNELKMLRFLSGAIVYLRDYEKKHDTHQICVVRGSRNEINKCMNLLRMRLPYERFPDLSLLPLNSDLEMGGFSFHDQECIQIATVTLPEDEFFHAKVTNVMQNGSVFIVLPFTISYLAQAKMMELLDRVYNSLMPIPGFEMDQLERILCVVCADSQWVRASICQILDETDEVSRSDNHISTNAYSSKDLLTLPIQAVQCKIANVQPIDCNMGWSSDAIEYLRELVLLKDLQAINVGNHNDLVDMRIVIDEVEYSISQCLIDAGYAIEIEAEEETLSSEVMMEWMKSFSDFFEE
ncbi:hypothetical protein PRIPAC_97994 [Pristionchus pacificus]|uniref:K Homology domain containing protein n=1 Tax=Pristionchus pacificus TaxID=54126 RepID=A0A2A6BCS0_PRIPA|nr:hypothetical protein PRIPAC_97994 [Pristionchus pacificus]|eukprot:PDM63690.1 K Homology domain containing protein [Pristionchus pacificus]